MHRACRTLLAGSAAASALLAASVAAGVPPASCNDTLLFGYFTSSDQLQYAWSSDGFHWTELNGGKPVFTANPSLRDPYVHRGPDGVFHLVATDSTNFGGTVNILTWSSPDLITWSPEVVAPVMNTSFFPAGASVQFTWAPEWFYDAASQRYMVFWAAEGSGLYTPPVGCTNNSTAGFAFYHAFTTDFKTFTPPAILFQPTCDIVGQGGIDGDIVQDENGRFVLVYKDARGVGEGHAAELYRGIRLVPSSGGLEGPYLNATISGFLAPTLVEAPELVFFKGQWLLFYDCSFWPTPAGYPRPPYGVSVSASLADYDFQVVEGACTGNSTDVSFPVGATHGSFVCIDSSELAALQAAFPS